jgi:integrase
MIKSSVRVLSERTLFLADRFLLLKKRPRRKHFSSPLVADRFRWYFSRLLTGLLTREHVIIMRNRLTPAFVASAKAESGAERTVYWDATMPGFGLMVTSAGHKSYVCQYRAGGRSRRLTIRTGVGLTAARREARKVLGDVAKGHDPIGDRRRKQGLALNTLGAIAEEYFAREGKRLRTADFRRAALERLVLPRFRSTPIGDISRSDIVRLLDKIEDERGPVAADRALAYLRRLMSWHASRSDDFRSPIVSGMARTRPSERARQRVLADDELRAVWRAAEADNSAFGCFLQFLLFTATRRAEAAAMRRTEITGSDWVIPSERYKTGRQLVVPLSPAAAAVLAKVPLFDGSDLVFTTDGRAPISGFSKFKVRFDAACGVTGWTLHDCRRTARSLMSRAGVPSDHAERCLGHVIGGVRGTYDRHEFYGEKRAAFEALAAQIGRIINPPPDNVLPLRAAQ